MGLTDRLKKHKITETKLYLIRTEPDCILEYHLASEELKKLEEDHSRFLYGPVPKIENSQENTEHIDIVDKLTGSPNPIAEEDAKTIIEEAQKKIKKYISTKKYKP